MQLSVIFVITLTVSVILSSSSTWGLTYSTSYDELQDMASGFVGLVTASMDEFHQLVLQLITDSSVLVSNLLSTQYNRSMVQLNQTEQELLQTTLSLMNQTRNSTAQSQSLVANLVISFGTFMQSAIADFTAMGTDAASRLRKESAQRVQLVFSEMLMNASLALRRTGQLYEMGILDVSRPADQPLDDATCTVMGSMCFPAVDFGISLYLGTFTGVRLSGGSSTASGTVVNMGATRTYSYYSPVAFKSGSDFPSWKQACVAIPAPSRISNCSLAAAQYYPDNCNGTCGLDPRCRPWFTLHHNFTTAKTRMTDVYPDNGSGLPVATLSYPIYSSTSQVLAVIGTDFYLSTVDAYLSTLSSTQLVAVVFNTSDLVVMGTSQTCPNSTARPSGKALSAACEPALQALGGWLALNRNVVGSASLELNGYLWDVFPGIVETFSYFVVVGMTKAQVYAVVTATSQAANQTLQALSQQQTARMAETEAASLAQMERLSADRIASLRAMEAQYTQYMRAEYVQIDQTFNASRRQSAVQLNWLTSTEMAAIHQLENFHLSKMKNSIGATFGAVVGIFVAVLLCGIYGTWTVTKQVENISKVMEDVAQMRVEELQVSRKSPIREVQRIEAALVVLVGRLAEYKSYMPAGLFQAEDEAPPEEQVCESPTSIQMVTGRKSSVGSGRSGNLRQADRAFSVMAASQLASRNRHVRPLPAVGGPRSKSNGWIQCPQRRTAAVMAVNAVRFQAQAAQHSVGQLEGMLNKVIAVVHGIVAKSQGNIDMIIGDQLLVTFNAHFACSDPSTVASNSALEVMGTLQGDFTVPWRVQIGLAAGSVYAGHLGTSSFKSMVALGAPLKVASMLSHLSGFEESTVLVCPSLEERIKYAFRLQPVDLVALPALGEHIPLYAKGIVISVLVDRASRRSGCDEWLYEIGDGERSGKWAATFRELVKLPSLAQATEDLQRYTSAHPEDRLALRLLRRLPQWQPRVGIVLAERPDGPRLGLTGDDGGVMKLAPCDL